MVNIPTTKRQYENVIGKANSLEFLSKALFRPAVETKETIMSQQKVKINSLSTKARMEINDLNNQWRLNNQANPNNESAKRELQVNINNILSNYRDQIDPMARMDWDATSNKITSAFEVANQNWAVAQNAENTKLDVAENINNNLLLAYEHGIDNNAAAGIADLDVSFRQLAEYAEKNIGATEARKLLQDYKSDYTSTFMTGLLNNNPYEARELMKTQDVRKSIRDPKKLDALTKAIDGEIQKIEYAQKIEDRFTSPNSLYDPKSSSDRKEVNNLYQNLIGENNLQESDRVAIGSEIAVKTGIMPNEMRAMIKKNLFSGNPENAISATAIINDLKNKKPQLLNNFTKSDLTFSNMITSNIDRGYSPLDAYKKTRAKLDVDEATRKYRLEDYKKEAGKNPQIANNRYLEDEFNTNPFWGLGEYKIPSELTGEFEQSVQDEYIISGDLEVARKTAFDNISKIWGKSEINGSKVMMKNAPEKVYGVPGLSDSENTKWIREQLFSEINKGSLSTYNDDEIVINPSIATNNNLPVYDIFIKKDGVVNTLPYKFQPKWEESKEYKRRAAKELKEAEARKNTARLRRKIINKDENIDQAFKEYFSADAI